MSSGSRGRLLDRIEVAYLAALGEVAEISDWYEQVRVVVSTDGAGGQAACLSGTAAAGMVGRTAPGVTCGWRG